MSKLPRGMETTDAIRTWNYLLHLPTGYSRSSDPWPMIIYLHGKSIRGSDLRNDLTPVKRYGIPAFLDRKPDFPFVVVSPQLPEGSWPEKSLLKLLDEITRKYNVDKDRVYLTGVNMGGAGVWYLAAADQKRFAAAAPLCGMGDESIVNKVTDIPIWAFHGDADKVTPLGPHQRLIAAVNKAGGNAKLSVIPDGTHGDIIFPTYQRKDLYDWFLSHSRKPKPAPVIPVAKPVEQPQPRPQPKLNPGKMITQIFTSTRKAHTVKKGDTLWRIGQTYDVPLDKLKRVNGLKTDTIKIGQTLVIPKS